MNMLTDVMFWREATTVGAFGLFLGICFWAYSKKQKDEFEHAAAIVFMDEDALGGVASEVKSLQAVEQSSQSKRGVE